jgi:hypothetical protein
MKERRLAPVSCASSVFRVCVWEGGAALSPGGGALSRSGLRDGEEPADPEEGRRGADVATREGGVIAELLGKRLGKRKRSESRKGRSLMLGGDRLMRR